MDEGNKVKQTVKMEGRPRMRCMANIRHDMNKCGLEEDTKVDCTVQNPDLAPQLDEGIIIRKQ